MIHPLRTFRNTILAIQLTITNCQRLGYALLTAIERQTAATQENTASTAELLSTAKAILAASTFTQEAVSYLAACEKRNRQDAGQVHEFEVPRVQ